MTAVPLRALFRNIDKFIRNCVKNIPNRHPAELFASHLHGFDMQYIFHGYDSTYVQ